METIGRHASSVALLVVLLFTFFVMMSYQVNRADTVSALESTIQTVVSPAHRVVSAVWLGISGGWTDYVGLIGRAAEVAALREQVATLERRNASLEEAGRENSRLRQLLDLEVRLEWPSIAARTIGRDTAHAYETITVNRGNRDGVAVDSPVLAANGVVVGMVVDVTPWTAIVQLATDPKSAIGAKVARTGAPGVVHGAGGPALELGYVSSLADVETGDLVVTSGDDSIYPAGLEIGRVSRVVEGAPVPGLPRLPALARAETALFLDIELRPSIDVRRVDQVLLLAPRPNGE